jgi:MOSC domain-containing protein YiiM
MMGQVPHLIAVFVGRVTVLGPNAVPSAFVKQQVKTTAQVEDLGLLGDSQADVAKHGGVDKAIYAYPSEHYAVWADEFPEHRALWGPGSLGENLSLSGLNERAVCIGDVFRLGSTVLQVTQPRKPCFKLALRFDDQRLGPRMIRQGRTGWYFRVIRTGAIEQGNELFLVRRPQPHWTIMRVNEAAYVRNTDEHVLRKIAALPEISMAWRDQTLAAANVVSRAAKLPT